MSFISNIQSVAKYESKLLIRSWFFKVFTVLAVLILSTMSYMVAVSEDAYGFWIARAIPSNIPYFILLLLNMGQAVIAIFLASDFLKRDKKLDTSEVFYVRPLSNAEYVIGKIWGNLRVFLILNILVTGITVVFNLVGVEVDWMAYFLYFMLISVPTLVFIIGLSIFLMLVIKNQALTFILLLGYIGLTVFYIGDKFYYVFDYMTYSLPLVKSTIVGIVNWETILNHRAIYLFAGLSFISFTICLFRRLPNSSRSNLPWLFIAIIAILLSITCGYRHVYSILNEDNMRSMYVSINNKYASSPKMAVEQYDISVIQNTDNFSAEVTMKSVALDSASVFTFYLNPGLTVHSAHSGNKQLGMKRESQILLLDFGAQIAKGDTISLTMKYDGRIDNSFCYLDIPAEVLQAPNKKNLFNIDKQYSFQTKDYLLFTPETSWYPRSGTSYSDKNPDWQQTYFSKYHLKVKPLPGLIPISQGEGKCDENGVYSFAVDIPSQTITLAIGDYEQKSTTSDSTLFSIWHLRGHDFFTAVLDSIQDTIPSQISEVRGNMQRNYKLEYPFKRLSLIEVPIQFASYTRTWSQAQETVQPEMVLFPEKGAIFEELNMKKRIQDNIKWSKYDGREISMKEAQMRAFNGFIWMFSRTEASYNFTAGSRGKGNLTAAANPYFLFPQFYNFKYNIFSPEWPVANRVLELYLQQKASNSGGWERDYNGISNSEKASLLLEKQPFKELLADAKLRDIQDHIIELAANRIFAKAEIGIGVNAFRDSLYAMLKRNTFQNIQFENMLDTLKTISGADIHSYLNEWKHPLSLPFYSIAKPELTRVVNPDGKEFFVLKVLISNNSDHDGVVHLTIRKNGWWREVLPDPRSSKKMEIPAHTNKQYVSVWEDRVIEVVVNTMISGNLPSTVSLNVDNVKEEKNKIVEQDKEYLLPEASLDVPGEIIVDNEDSTLFSITAPPVVGLLQKWMDRVEETPFKYSGTSWWRPPFQWTLTTNAKYHGKYIRSAYVIKSGDGTQTATWKVPIKEAGQYDVYYHVFKEDELRWNDWVQGENHFKVMYDKEVEDAYINLKKSKDGWEQIGTYFFNPDTVRIVLTNECKLRRVTADAVKVVKR